MIHIVVLSRLHYLPDLAETLGIPFSRRSCVQWCRNLVLKKPQLIVVAIRMQDEERLKMAEKRSICLPTHTAPVLGIQINGSWFNTS